MEAIANHNFYVLERPSSLTFSAAALSWWYFVPSASPLFQVRPLYRTRIECHVYWERGPQPLLVPPWVSQWWAPPLRFCQQKKYCLRNQNCSFHFSVGPQRTVYQSFLGRTNPLNLGKKGKFAVAPRGISFHFVTKVAKGVGSKVDMNSYPSLNNDFNFGFGFDSTLFC